MSRHNTIKILLFVLTNIFILTTVNSFQVYEEARYLDNFNNLIKDSYSRPLPSKVRDACKDKGKLGNVAERTLPRSMSASEVQSFCGVDTRCIVPPGVQVTMNGDLNLGGLVLKGNLVWNDQTQGASEQFLCAGFIAIEGGSFSLDVQAAAFYAFVYIKNNGMSYNRVGHRGIAALDGGKLFVKGRPMARTWSLLASPVQQGDNFITLLHKPIDMGWEVGNRLVIAPTTKFSSGSAEVVYIKGFDNNNNQIYLASDASLINDASVSQSFFATSKYIDNAWTAQMQAEVINTDRHVIITGDDFEHIPCDPAVTDARDGCQCTGQRTKCTMGTHTSVIGSGVLDLQYTRVEKCGQRGIMGKYCVHLHALSSCPNCVVKGNAIEYSHQRGIVIHGSSLATISENVLNDVRGGNIYMEDGNEMFNQITYNVMICPWAFTGNKEGCTIPGTDNEQADTSLNQAGLWGTSFTNHMIGNRVANSFNGMLYQAQGFENGRGLVFGKLCSNNQLIGYTEGNTFHGHGRFGTYLLVSVFPKKTDRSLASNGVVTDRSTCDAFDANGEDRGVGQVITGNVDYDNVFVGQYQLGDIQYRNHASINNLNLIYWKETKNFADGCSAHVLNAHYEGSGGSNVALPGGHGTFIMENVKFTGWITFECSHHCNVGVTGVLCMPTYVFVNPTWEGVTSPSYVSWGANNGAMFVLAPGEEANPRGAIFPAGYCSLVHPFWTYLLALDGGSSCKTAAAVASSLGQDVTSFSNKYGGGILCKRPVRRLEIYTKGQNMASARNVKLELWQNGGMISSQVIKYFQIGQDSDRTNKQGYATTVVTGLTHEYRLSLEDGGPIPAEWSIEFSDPVFGNRWQKDEINLRVAGRNCPPTTSSQHDRRYIWGDSNGNWLIKTGRGACSGNPDSAPVDCSRVSISPYGTTCPEKCGSCANGLCDCNTGKCICKPGFTGPDCSTDVCAMAGCSGSGRCSAKYLGGSLPVTKQECVCKPGFFGDKCESNTPAPTPVPTFCCDFLTDTDLGGGDVGNVAGSSKEDCCRQCGSNTGCSAFAYAGGRCYLKDSSAVNKQKSGVAGVVSGIRKRCTAAPAPPVAAAMVVGNNGNGNGNCMNGCSYTDATDYPGNDLFPTTVGSKEECCDRCGTTAGCTAWTLLGTTCYMKTTVAFSKSASGLISGKRC